MKKIVTGVLTATMVMLLMMPFVSAWSTYESVNLKYGRGDATSSEVGLSKKGYYTAKNTTTDSLKGKITMYCSAAYYTSLYTTEYSTLISVGQSVSHTEPQDILSKYKVTLKAAPLWKETGAANVKI